MTQPLVTIRSYFDPLDAEMAVNLLRAEGIEASLADAKFVSNTWHLANAVQGIKLQVLEQDRAKAVYYLGEIDSARSERLADNRVDSRKDAGGSAIDDEDDDEDALDDDFDDYGDEEAGADHIIPWSGGYAATYADDDPDTPPNRAEANAERAFKGAAFGLIFIPLQFYVTLLLADVFFGGEPLRPRYRRRAIVAGVVNVAFLAVLTFYLRYSLALPRS